MIQRCVTCGTDRLGYLQYAYLISWRNVHRIQLEMSHFISFSFYTFRVRPSGLTLVRINLELLSVQTVDRIPWTGDELCRKAAAYTGKTRTQKKCGETFMHRVGFEPKIPLSERTKTVRTLDREAAVIGSFYLITKFQLNYFRICVARNGITFNDQR